MKKIIVAITLLAAAQSSVRATPVFSDNFDYPNGGTVANSAGVWEPNTGTPGLSLVTNNQLYVSTSLQEDIKHQFTTAFQTNGAVSALYSSFKVKFIALPSQAGSYFAHFSGTNAFGTLSGFRARVFASRTNFAAVPSASQFCLGIVNSGLGNATNGQWATPLETNVTYTVVTRYEVATGVSTLWIDPSSELDPGVTASDTIPSGDFGPNGFPTNAPVNITHYGFRQATGIGTMLIDDLRIGTAFNDVAGANTAPNISPIAKQNTPRDTPTAPIPFTVSDQETVASGLLVTNSSSNPALVPNGNISIVDTGDGTNRTITITPAAGQQGSATITVSVTDLVNTNSTSFVLTVGAPSITSIANQIAYSNQALTGIAFTIGDAESDSLTLSNASSNPTLITNIVVVGGGSSRTLTLTPEANQTGVADITIYVTDGINVASTTFTLSVSPNLGVLLSDVFSYDGFALGNALYGANLGSTNSPWQHSTSGGGSPYEVQVVNNMAELVVTNGEDVAANLANGPFGSGSGIVLYSGFSVTATNLPSRSGNYFAHFKDTINGTTFRGKIYASTTNAAVGFYRIGIANNANTVNAQFALDLSLNQSYRVVTRYNSGTAETVLWINPTSESSPSVSAQDSTTPASIGAYGLRQANDNFDHAVLDLDDLIISTAFSDVSLAVSPIPLTYSVAGGQITLTWADSSFELQAAPAVTGTYTNVPGAVSTGYTTDMTETQTYFRLKR